MSKVAVIESSEKPLPEGVKPVIPSTELSEGATGCAKWASALATISEPFTFVGRSSAFQALCGMVDRCRLTREAILIEGEIGSGKSEIVKAIHRNSQPVQELVTYDCQVDDEAIFNVLTNDTLEQMVVLEEIGATSRPLQNLLLKKLEESPTHGTRVLATSSVALDQLETAGKIRSELFYALGAIRISVPPLRERLDDLQLLTCSFIRRLNRDQRFAVSDNAFEVLENYRWPGNLDELNTVIRQAAFQASTDSITTGQHDEFLITATHLPNFGSPDSTNENSGSTTDWDAFVAERLASDGEDLYAQSVAEMERMLLHRVMRATGGNQTQAARVLGITRGNLRKKIRSLGMTVQRVVTSAEGQ